MKTNVQNWMSGVTRFLTGVSDDNRPVVRQEERRPPVNVDAVELRDRHDNAAPEQPPVVAEEFQGPETAVDDLPGETETVSPPLPAVSDQPVPTGADVTSPIENTEWLRDQLEVITGQLESQGDGLRKVKESAARAEDVRSLLEEQEKVIQDLARRLREAEEKEIIAAVMEPVVAGLIQLFDTVWNAKQDWKRQRPGNVDEWVVNCLGTLDGEIADMLDRCSVNLIQDTTTVVNRSRQRVIGTEPIRQFRDGEVVGKGKPGFTQNGRVRRPEEVITAVTTEGGVR